MRYLSVAILFLSLTFLYTPLQAQDLTQRLRGRVLDANTYRVLPLSNVKLLDSDESIQFEATSGEDGKFLLEKVAYGRYQLQVLAEGYETYIIPDFQIGGGKEVVLDFSLQATIFEAAEVEINSKNEREFDRPSIHMIKVEDTEKLAASFFDPARVVASYSGVVQSDNQSNNLIIRGNSPTGIRWRLEGVAIANPNHLPNAGTFSDRISLSGGGQSILSTQLMANSIFSKGAFSAEYGDALSGVFDMRLRAGNNQKNEFTVQAGLIGLDLSAEGPISKKSGSSFLVNYRYSFTGLLAAMGVTFGGEDIRFQDIAFNLSFPTEKAGSFTIFGMGGQSSNVFKGARVDTAIAIGKDRFDIDFGSRTGAIGMTHTISLGTKSSLRTVLSTSRISSSREGKLIENLDNPAVPVEEDELSQGFLTLTTGLTHQVNPKLYLKSGIYLTYQSTRVLSTFRPFGSDSLITRASHEGATQLLRPYLSIRYQAKDWLSLDLGLHAQYLTLNGSFVLEPRVNIHTRLNQRHHLSVAYGLHSQQQLPQIYFTRLSVGGESAFPNQDLGFTQAHHAVLSYKYRHSENLSFSLEPYFQYLFNVPIVPDLNRPISTLNLIEGVITDSLVNEGLGRNYGVEAAVNKYLSDRFYTIITASFYESQYTGFDGEWRDTRFNGNYAFTASLGYEYDRLTKKGKNRVWGANIRIVQTGGLLLQQVDTLASIEQQQTVFDETQGFTDRMDDLFRIDLGFSFKQNRAKRSRVLSLNIQNLTNNQPLAFRVFDIVEQKVVERRRFGMIPVLSYRLEF
ncbi:MAG: TonB-dependent receptor [Bacteroidia bacterium]|nr:TonB-dependent receptor [Bacteroidia bacterium]